MEKNEVRKHIRELKKNYSLEEKKELSQSVWEQVEQDENFQKAKIVLGYWSMDDEVFTHDFIIRWADKKKFLLPCVKGDKLEIRCFNGINRLSPGEGFHIPEPVDELFSDFDRIDIILVPGVAFDYQNNRLGRGKGYYDKILKNSKAYKIGICFHFQYVDNVPIDVHDVPMSIVIKSYENKRCKFVGFETV